MTTPPPPLNEHYGSKVKPHNQLDMKWSNKMPIIQYQQT